MTFAVEFTDVAEMEAQEIFLWILSRSPDHADRWQLGLEKAVTSLSHLPERCPLAPESRSFDRPIRQLLYGPYRILFTIVDADGDGKPETVRLLHIRHGARRRLDEPEQPD